MNQEEFRSASQKIWDKMAKGWDENRDYLWETSKPVGMWMVEKLEPRSGQTVLELAAGMGDTGFVASGLIRPGGKLISTDFAPAMVKRAEGWAAKLGVTNAEFQVLDAERMDLETDSVDGVLCRWGYMLMSDPAAALRETRRVLRPGGRLAFSVFAGPDQNPWAARPAKALVEAGLMQPPTPGSPGILALGNRDRLEAMVKDAGFSEAAIEEVPVTWQFRDFDAFWQFLTGVAGAIAALIEALPPEKQLIAKEAIRSAVSDYETATGISLPGMTLNVIAR